jgi:hypothetical protein
VRKLFLISLAVVVLLAVTLPALAHHAFNAEFDANKPVKLRGKVTKMEWINPHAWVHIEVPETDGKVTAWMVELAAPNAMLRRGWNRNSLPIGTEILVDGYMSKDGAKRANGSIVTFTDGKKLFVGSSNPNAPDIDRPQGK